MNVYDLDCFSDLTHSDKVQRKITGGSIEKMMLSLKIVDRQLSIALGQNTLLETVLPEKPSGIQISIEDNSGNQSHASSFSVGRGIKHLSVFGSQVGNGYRSYSFSSSSSGSWMF